MSVKFGDVHSMRSCMWQEENMAMYHGGAFQA